MNDVRFSEEEMKLERQRMHTSINRKAKQKRNRFLVASVAASFAIIVVSYIFISRESGPVYFSEDQTEYQPKQNKEIVLTLPGDSVLVFDEDTEVKIDEQGALVVNGSNQKALFASKVTQAKTDTVVQMNKLVVPWGKRSSLMLADGSKIWINSGSTLEFPSVLAALNKSGRRNLYRGC